MAGCFTYHLVPGFFLLNRFVVWIYALLPYQWRPRHAFPFVVDLLLLQCCVSLPEDFMGVSPLSVFLFSLFAVTSILVLVFSLLTLDRSCTLGDSISWIFGYLVEFLLQGLQEIYRLNKQIKHRLVGIICVPIFRCLVTECHSPPCTRPQV